MHMRCSGMLWCTAVAKMAHVHFFGDILMHCQSVHLEWAALFRHRLMHVNKKKNALALPQWNKMPERALSHRLASSSSIVNLHCAGLFSSQVGGRPDGHNQAGWQQCCQWQGSGLKGLSTFSVFHLNACYALRWKTFSAAAPPEPPFYLPAPGTSTPAPAGVSGPDWTYW